MQNKFNSVFKLTASVILAASAASASAQSAGDTVVTAGWFHIMPQDSSTPIAITSPTPRTLPGSGATVNKANTLGFAVTSFLTDNWAATLDLGVPPKYKLNGTGTLESVGQVGTAKQWAPALLAKYYFGEANSQFRPSIGLGLSRVHYTNIELSKGFQEYIGAGVGNKNAVTTADLKASWAPVFNAGLSYAIDKDWSVNFSVSYLKMKTKADLTTKASATTTVLSNTTMTINPIVTYLNIGYRF